MDPDRFEPALHALFDEFPVSPNPNGRRFTRILDEVPGLASENNLALLNLAASMLEPGESYVEVGSLRGTSLIAAMVGNDDADFVAIDDFSMDDASPQAPRAATSSSSGSTCRRSSRATRSRSSLQARSRASASASTTTTPGHSYEQQIDGLRMIEPWLADRALLIVDDTDWEQVEQRDARLPGAASRRPDCSSGSPARTTATRTGGRA